MKLDRDSRCLMYHPFQGDETDVRVLGDKFLTVRCSQKCVICWEIIPIGTRVRARREINNEDRTAMTFYFCEPCCDAMAISWDDDGRAIERRTSLGMQAAKERG